MLSNNFLSKFLIFLTTPFLIFSYPKNNNSVQANSQNNSSENKNPQTNGKSEVDIDFNLKNLEFCSLFGCNTYLSTDIAFTIELADFKNVITGGPVKVVRIILKVAKVTGDKPSNWNRDLYFLNRSVNGSQVMPFKQILALYAYLGKVPQSVADAFEKQEKNKITDKKYFENVLVVSEFLEKTLDIWEVSNSWSFEDVKTLSVTFGMLKSPFFLFKMLDTVLIKSPLIYNHPFVRQINFFYTELNQGSKHINNENTISFNGNYVTIDGTEYRTENNTTDELWKKLQLYKPYIDGDNSTSIPNRGANSAIKFNFDIAFDYWDDGSNGIKFTDVTDIVFDPIELEAKSNDYKWSIDDWESVSNKTEKTEKLVFKNNSYVYSNWSFYGVILRQGKNGDPTYNIKATDVNSSGSRLLKQYVKAESKDNIREMVTKINATIAFPYSEDKNARYSNGNLVFALSVGQPEYKDIAVPDPSKMFIPDEETKFNLSKDRVNMIANTPVTFDFEKSTYEDIDKVKEVSVDGIGQKYPNFKIDWNFGDIFNPKRNNAWTPPEPPTIPPKDGEDQFNCSADDKDLPELTQNHSFTLAFIKIGEELFGYDYNLLVNYLPADINIGNDQKNPDGSEVNFGDYFASDVPIFGDWKSGKWLSNFDPFLISRIHWTQSQVTITQPPTDFKSPKGWIDYNVITHKAYKLVKSPNGNFYYWIHLASDHLKDGWQFLDGVYKFEVTFKEMPSLNHNQYLIIQEDKPTPTYEVINILKDELGSARDNDVFHLWDTPVGKTMVKFAEEKLNLKRENLLSISNREDIVNLWWRLKLWIKNNDPNFENMPHFYKPGEPGYPNDPNPDDPSKQPPKQPKKDPKDGDGDKDKDPNKGKNPNESLPPHGGNNKFTDAINKFFSKYKYWVYGGLGALFLAFIGYVIYSNKKKEDYWA